MPEITIHNPDVLGKPLGQYSQITRVKASEFLFIAGQVGMDRSGKIVDEGDFDAQCRQAFANIEAALKSQDASFANVVEFQSLSKRSNLPGLRIGFAAGDSAFLARFLELRNVAAPQVPMPAQRVAIAAYGEETHVEANRRLYAQKFDLADQIIGARYGYRRPPGGFFLWLDVSAQGGGEAAALRLWREAGLRVVPGRYLARDQDDGSNPGAGYIRVAMVQDRDTTAEALHRLVAVLG